MLLRLAELDVALQLREALRARRARLLVPHLLRDRRLGRARRRDHPWVDAISVWRGPTDYVVAEQPQVFDDVSIAFRVPGEDGAANLGPPDILFFALFLAAAARFGLRVVWTWLAMTALLGVTLILAATTDVGGLPALPADLRSASCSRTPT